MRMVSIFVLALTGLLSGAATSSAQGVAADDGQLVTQALETLLGFARERPLRVQVASGWTAGGEAALWIVAEVMSTSSDDWSQGGQAEVKVLDARGATVATQEVQLRAVAGPMSARLAVKLSSTASLGEYQVQVRARNAARALPASETVRISLAAAPDSKGVLFGRRSITTGNRETATADLRFRRSERLIVMLPAPSPDAVSGRLLDRTGKTVAIPVTAAIRDEADGSRWRTAEVALAPLAAGEYLVEITAAGERTLTAFRVLP